MGKHFLHYLGESGFFTTFVGSIVTDGFHKFSKIMKKDIKNEQRQPASLMHYAMNYGTTLGVYYVLKFILFPLSLTNGVAGLLFLALTVLVPVVAYRLARHFRDHVTRGFISGTLAWSFILQMFLFASLLTAVAHYIYFAYLDHGAVAESFATAAETYKTMVQEMGMGDATSQLEAIAQTTEMLTKMTAGEMTLNMFSNNLFWGCLLTIPLALIVRRKGDAPGPDTSTNEQ